MYKIASKTLMQTENLGNGLVNKLSNELDVQYSKFEARMKEQKDEDRIRVAMCVFTIFTTNHPSTTRREIWQTHRRPPQ